MVDAETDEIYLDTEGVRHLFVELKDRLPSMIYLGQLHVDVCKRIADLQKFGGLSYKVYVNLMVKHSRHARNITALISLIRHGDIHVSAIESKYAVTAVLQRFIDVDEINFSSDNLIDVSFLREGAVFKLFVKTIVHRFYRIFYRRKYKSMWCVRSWVEITETMYGEHFDKSLVLIYPFYLNLARHLRYIRHCFNSYPRTTLCGLPYSLLDWLRLALIARRFDHNYVQFELVAYRAHGTELIANMGKTLYTSDEFEAGAIAMVSEFKARGGSALNMAHGLSFGCPYVAYDEFTVYNSAQKKYYARNSPDTCFSIAPRINAGVADFMQIDQSGPQVVIFVEANYNNLGMKFEARLQALAIDVIMQLAIERNLKAVIKAHPNRNVSEYAGYAKETGIAVIKNLTELGSVRPVFVTIASAAYYDFRQFGPFIFVDDGYSDLMNFYGEKLNAYSVADLAGGITTCLDAED